MTDVTWELFLDPSVNTLPVSLREMMIEFWKGDCILRRMRITIPTSDTGAVLFYSPLFDCNSEDGSWLSNAEPICADMVTVLLTVTMTDYSLWNSKGRAELAMMTTSRKDLAQAGSFTSFVKRVAVTPGMRYLGLGTIELNMDFIDFALSGNTFVSMSIEKVAIPDRFLAFMVNFDNV